jgi:hypothetical protein
MREISLVALVRAWQITVLAASLLVTALSLSHVEWAAYLEALQMVLARDG